MRVVQHITGECFLSQHISHLVDLYEGSYGGVYRVKALKVTQCPITSTYEMWNRATNLNLKYQKGEENPHLKRQLKEISRGKNTKLTWREEKKRRPGWKYTSFLTYRWKIWRTYNWGLGLTSHKGHINVSWRWHRKQSGYKRNQDGGCVGAPACLWQISQK